MDPMVCHSASMHMVPWMLCINKFAGNINIMLYNNLWQVKQRFRTLTCYFTILSNEAYWANTTWCCCLREAQIRVATITTIPALVLGTSVQTWIGHCKTKENVLCTILKVQIYNIVQNRGSKSVKLMYTNFLLKGGQIWHKGTRCCIFGRKNDERKIHSILRNIESENWK